MHTTLVRYRSVESIIRANRRRAHTHKKPFWFGKGETAFFNTVVHTTTPIKGRFFVTSEAMEATDTRRYTVREAKSDATVVTRGEFLAHSTLDDAIAAALAMEPSDD